METEEVIVVKDSQGNAEECQLFSKVSKTTEDEGHEDWGQ